jgi:XTP/dITP diphosphohydrolase
VRRGSGIQLRAGDRVLVATRSGHKLRELRQLLDEVQLELVSLDDVGIEEEVAETGRTFEANARLKARTYGRLSGMPTLADDSGLEVEALGGAPGVRTRRFAGERATDADNNAKLLASLDGRSADDRAARYVCVLALALPGERGSGQDIVLARGTVRGRIATTLRGSGGFGYDPIFEPSVEPVGGRTFGEWTAAEKNRISHRARAARHMARQLRRLWSVERGGDAGRVVQPASRRPASTS